MNYYLGLDGGGTRTRFLLCGEDGQASAVKVIDTIHLHQVGESGMRQKMVQTLKDVCREAQITPSQIKKAFFGLAGYGEVKEEQVFMDKLSAEILPSALCGNDVQAAWAGAHGALPGIQIVAGTGSIAYARNESGEETRCGGWGHFFGDEGSAYWLAQEALTLFSRQSDGRLPRAPLYSLIRNHFQLGNDFDLIGIYQSTFLNNRTKTASIAPLVFEAARLGDISAQDLVQHCARELAQIAHVAAEALSWNTGPIPISYSGGVWQAGKLLLQPLEKYLHGFNRRYSLRPPILSPVAGAVYYAYVLSNEDKGNTSNYLERLVQTDRRIKW